MIPSDFEFLRRLLRVRSGLALAPEKYYLVENRLMPVARKAGLDTLEALVARLRRPDGEVLAAEVVEAMATKETFFFRDRTPFLHIRDTVMPALLSARATRRQIRIWCAACSTGQEAYSLAMTLKEMESALKGWRVEILATDLSGEALARAAAGAYSQFEVQRGLPIQHLVRHFVQDGETWRVSPALRTMVRFQQHNLLGSFAPLGTFDLILCRNVLIYFDTAAKQEVLRRLAEACAPDGFLLLGGAETVIGLSEAWQPLPEHHALCRPVPATESGGLSVVRAARV